MYEPIFVGYTQSKTNVIPNSVCPSNPNHLKINCFFGASRFGMFGLFWGWAISAYTHVVHLNDEELYWTLVIIIPYWVNDVLVNSEWFERA